MKEGYGSSSTAPHEVPKIAKRAPSGTCRRPLSCLKGQQRDSTMQYINKRGYCIFQPNRTKIGRRLHLVDTEQPPMNPIIYASHHGYMEDAVAKNTIPARKHGKSWSLPANAHGRSFPLRTNAPWRHTSLRTSCGRVNVSLGATTPQFFAIIVSI